MAKNRVIGHIQYSLGLRSANPSEKDSEKKVYPTAQQIETIDLDLLADHIKEHGSPFSKGTIYGVLTDMVECVIELLRGGYGVLLDGLGKFGVSLSAEGADSAEQFSTANIKSVNLTFNPDSVVKSELNSKMEFDYVATRKAQAEAKKAEKAALSDGTSGSGSDSGNQGGSGSGDPGDVTP